MNVRTFIIRARARAHRAKAWMADDAGYSTETVIVTALLVILALSAIGVIASKVLAKANGLDLG
ncbi:hypothetical protein [Streptomyces violascens]|uniref:hypothetical protein n=1 Tax=Streptomyces violascens TaxID=67381 RepID=UPI00366678AD